MPELKSWGVQYSPEMHHDFKCYCGGGDYLLRPEKYVPLLVGFSTEGPGIGRVNYGNLKKLGIAVFECDTCFERFWFHLNQIMVEHFKTKAPQWPKD